MSYVIVHYLGIYFFHLMIFWIINDPSGGVFWQRQTGAASHAIICVYIKCFIMVYTYIIQQDKATFYNKPIITVGPGRNDTQVTDSLTHMQPYI